MVETTWADKKIVGEVKRLYLHHLHWAKLSRVHIRKPGITQRGRTAWRTREEQHLATAKTLADALGLSAAGFAQDLEES
jgi:hypothetical protein